MTMNKYLATYVSNLVKLENLDNHIQELMNLDNEVLKVIKENTNKYNKDTINQVLKHREARG